MKRFGSLISILLAVMVLGLGQATAREIVGPAKVIDGDTIYIGEHKIRLSGFDAPESEQTCQANKQTYDCGAVATEGLGQLTAGQTVQCQTSDKDRYGRWIASCRVNGTDLGAWMVGNGLAVAYRRYSTAYVADEEAAKAKELGLWAGPFVMPWDWRQGKRLAKAPTSNQACDIKGNISSSGERIYHTKDSPWYGRTKINEAQGERWFCSEQEAMAAGWRPAKH